MSCTAKIKSINAFIDSCTAEFLRNSITLGVKFMFHFKIIDISVHVVFLTDRTLLLGLMSFHTIIHEIARIIKVSGIILNSFYFLGRVYLIRF